jgi:putative addiction module component (TIGR02574 family)
MSPKAEQLLREALDLPVEERASLAESLMESLEEGEDEAETAWNAEIDRRIQEVRSGEVRTIPWNEARRILGWDT